MALGINIFILIILIFVDDKMNMLQIPTTFVNIIDWFNSLNIEFKVLIAVVAIALSMVLIYIAFKLLEVVFLLLKVILNVFSKIFRKSSKIKEKIILSNEEYEKSEEIDLSEREKVEEDEVNYSHDSDDEEKQIIIEEDENFREEDAGKSKTMDPNNRSDSQEFTTENSVNMIQCPNCGIIFSQNSFSMIGDTLFVSCEECGKRYISNGKYLKENEE